MMEKCGNVCEWYSGHCYQVHYCDEIPDHTEDHECGCGLAWDNKLGKSDAKKNPNSN
jgi:hypothetical protein